MSAEPRPAGTHRAAAESLAALPGVVAVDVIAGDPALGGPVVELAVGPKYQRVPPRVLRTLAEHDLGIHEMDRSGDYYRVVAA